MAAAVAPAPECYPTTAAATKNVLASVGYIGVVVLANQGSAPSSGCSDLHGCSLWHRSGKRSHGLLMGQDLQVKP